MILNGNAYFFAKVTVLLMFGDSVNGQRGLFCIVTWLQSTG